VNQWRKGIARWTCGRTLYLSVPFTWLLDDARRLAEAHSGKVVAGGPAVKLMGAPWASETPDECPFDVLAMHNPCATFTTRGCPNRCAFCAVPRIEGDFRELPTWKPAPVVCDNNLLACSKAHFERVIDSLRPFPAVDFNQGLEAARLTDYHLDRLGSVRVSKFRFSFDLPSDEKPVRHAIAKLVGRRVSPRRIMVYVLIGFGEGPQEALWRLREVSAMGVRPFPMRYVPLDAKRRVPAIPDGWTRDEMRKMVYYWSRLRWVEQIPYEHFVYPKPQRLPLFDQAPEALPCATT
jgi:hypothetical protein